MKRGGNGRGMGGGSECSEGPARETNRKRDLLAKKVHSEQGETKNSSSRFSKKGSQGVIRNGNGREIKVVFVSLTW